VAIWVAPVGGLGHLDHELTDLLRLPGSTRLAPFGLRLALADPAGKRPGMDDGDQFLDRRPEADAQLDEPSSLGRRHVDPLGELAPQNPVLGLEVLDRLDQIFLGRPGNQHQEGVDQLSHLGRIRKSVGTLEMACFWDPATPPTGEEEIACQPAARGSSPRVYLTPRARCFRAPRDECSHAFVPPVRCKKRRSVPIRGEL
jgi:hypothetical protein